MTSTPITIKNNIPASATTDHIVVKKDISANITLAGVNIYAKMDSPFSPFMIEDDSTGDVTITLAENSENTLTTTERGFAGLQKNGSGADIGKLTITGTGKLTAIGGDGGAGIGGGQGGSGSNITISDGTVTATGRRFGAGIGGGYSGSGSNITISGGTVTAIGRRFGAGIGGGAEGSGSNITISGGSVRAVKGEDAPNDIGGGSGRAAVTPKNAEEHDVYLMTIPNPSNAKVYIDGKEYKPYNHSAISEDNNTNLYAYVTGVHHTVKVGTETSCYHFVNNVLVKCEISNSLMNDANGHGYACSDENCYIQHDFAEHTFDQEVDDEKFEVANTVATCKQGKQYYKSCICGVKGNETFEGTVLDSSNHVGTLGDWQMTDGEHWKEYSECGCKENKGVHKDETPVDHKCDDCGKILSVCEDKNFDHYCDYCGKLNSGHDMKHHEAAEPECTVNGNTEYYECEFCGKYYSDANGKNEITLESTVIPATGHSYEWGECTECGSEDPDANIIIKIVRYCINWLTEFVESCVVWVKEAPVSILYWFIGIFTGDTKIF